jgi:hypothetical protein
VISETAHKYLATPDKSPAGLGGIRRVGRPLARFRRRRRLRRLGRQVADRLMITLDPEIFAEIVLVFVWGIGVPLLGLFWLRR